MFQLKYLSSEARYEKSVKGLLVISKALLNEQRIFLMSVRFKEDVLCSLKTRNYFFSKYSYRFYRIAVMYSDV